MTTAGPPRRPLQLPFAPLVFGRRSDTGDMVEIDADELVRHLAVFGTTGSGKTSLFLALMLQLMDRGRGFIVCTTKHDPTMPRALAWAALQRQQLICPEVSLVIRSRRSG